VTIRDTQYRALGASTPNAGGASIAVLAPLAQAEAAVDTAVRKLLFGLVLALAAVALVAYLEGRSIVRTVGGLVDAARAIAGGRLSERVPRSGRS
jgi:nitrogen fixation/metabolism regulation signal transduction histidine kinase